MGLDFLKGGPLCGKLINYFIACDACMCSHFLYCNLVGEPYDLVDYGGYEESVVM